MNRTLLIVEDEETLRESLSRLFTKEGYTVESAESAERALPMVSESSFDVIISDIILPGIDGIEMLTRIKEDNPGQIIIIMTAYASLDTSVRALRLGAYDYIMKPIMHEEIKRVVANSIKQKQLQHENILLKRQIDMEYDFSSVIGTSVQLKVIMEDIEQVAPSKSNVLLLGETGTGKELFARIIHQNSQRSEMPFVPINCSAIPETLLESELFGHAKGAFTGAINSKVGLLEEAEGGTVFLDEIGDMPVQFQVKLLRVLEDQEIRLIGSTKTRKVDIRFITATNRDLKELVREGSFREDLYYRINVISFELPPLRDRREDIGLLAEHFTAKYVTDIGKGQITLGKDAMEALKSYAWPGNVRELQNVLERAVLLCREEVISPSMLPDTLFHKSSFLQESMDKNLSIEEYTKAFISHFQDVYSEQDLAEKLGISRKTLWEKRKKWGFSKPA
jgi:DNA-binding NtrC family response regulator